MKSFTLSITIFILLAGCVTASEKIAPKMPNLSVAEDFLDNAYFTKHEQYYTKEELYKRLKIMADAGVKTFYLRVTAGKAYYPSKVLDIFSGDGRTQWDFKLVNTIGKYDVVAENIKAAHELGMKIYYWEPVFDTQIYLRYGPDSEKAKKYGEFPFEDSFFTKRRDLYWKHRFADKYGVQQLNGTIGKIVLYSYFEKPPRIKKDEVIILTADDGKPFKRYEGDFTYSVEKAKGRKGYLIVLDNLQIEKQCIKIANSYKDNKFTVAFDLNTEFVELYYTNGKKIELFSTYEMLIPPDEDLENTLRGAGGGNVAWDYKGRTLIIRTGLFDRYAGGLPCYAYKESRDRRLSIIKELLDNYPQLDGICYSLRSHSMPSGGSIDRVGRFRYGFNDIYVKDYKKKYGIDITKEDYDVEKFLKIRGKYFTDFIREAGTLIHKYGKKFTVMAPVRSSVPNHSHGSMYKLWEGYDIDNFFEIETWAKEGLVDTVMMLGTYARPMPNWPKQWDQEIAAFRKKLKKTGVKLSLMHQINSKSPKDIARILPHILKNKNLDEVCFYEEETLYKKAGMYDAIIAAYKPQQKQTD